METKLGVNNEKKKEEEDLKKKIFLIFYAFVLTSGDIWTISLNIC